MQFSDQDLRAAVSAGALEAEKLNPLLAFLGTRAIDAAPADHAAVRFDLAHLLWYAGALIVITAMGLFSTLAFSAMGGWALTATAVVYATVFAIAGDYLWYKRNLRVPGGLLIAIAVSMAPLAVYGIQDAMGMWGTFGRPGTMHDFYVWIKGSWVYMEIAAIIAAVIALWRYPFPFIVLIIAVALWFLSMDLTPWIFGRAEFTWDERRIVSLWFGLAVLVVAYLVDRRPRGGDFAFWLHLFGLMAFWGGLSLSNSGSELGKLLYALHQCRPAVDVGGARAARLCGVRHARHRRLSRPPLVQGVPGLDDVPVRADADRYRHHRGGIALPPPSSGDRYLGREQHSRCAAQAAARARAVRRVRLLPY